MFLSLPEFSWGTASTRTLSPIPPATMEDMVRVGSYPTTLDSVERIRVGGLPPTKPDSGTLLVAVFLLFRLKSLRHQGSCAAAGVVVAAAVEAAVSWLRVVVLHLVARLTSIRTHNDWFGGCVVVRGRQRTGEAYRDAADWGLYTFSEITWTANVDPASAEVWPASLRLKCRVLNAAILGTRPARLGYGRLRLNHVR